MKKTVTGGCHCRAAGHAGRLRHHRRGSDARGGRTIPADANPKKSTENFTDEMKIPYAIDLSPERWADSVERAGDHADSPYFAHRTSTIRSPPTPSRS
jgi:hypothetical protein